MPRWNSPSRQRHGWRGRPRGHHPGRPWQRPTSYPNRYSPRGRGYYNQRSQPWPNAPNPHRQRSPHDHPGYWTPTPRPLRQSGHRHSTPPPHRPRDRRTTPPRRSHPHRSSPNSWVTAPSPRWYGTPTPPRPSTHSPRPHRPCPRPSSSRTPRPSQVLRPPHPTVRSPSPWSPTHYSPAATPTRPPGPPTRGQPQWSPRDIRQPLGPPISPIPNRSTSRRGSRSPRTPPNQQRPASSPHPASPAGKSVKFSPAPQPPTPPPRARRGHVHIPTEVLGAQVRLGNEWTPPILLAFPHLGDTNHTPHASPGRQGNRPPTPNSSPRPPTASPPAGSSPPSAAVRARHRLLAAAILAALREARDRIHIRRQQPEGQPDGDQGYQSEGNDDTFNNNNNNNNNDNSNNDNDDDDGANDREV